MARRRANGEGTISPRKDGRYEAALWVTTAAGIRKRKRWTCQTRDEADAKLTEAKAQALRGLPVPDQVQALEDYAEYWLGSIVKAKRRPTTYLLYETTMRLHLKPGLGRHPLAKLTVRMVQGFLDAKLIEGHSIRMVQLMRAVLSAVLTQAQREELVTRNVARLVELPTWQRREINPWTGDEARRFLEKATESSLYPAFLLLVLFGLRRGEVLGLRWEDVDFDRREIRVRQQLIRAGREILQGPLKTKAARRDLPMVGLAFDALLEHRAHQSRVREAEGSNWRGSNTGSELVFTTKSGLHIEPRNFVRSFEVLCRRHGLRTIALHHLRHTAATLLKDRGVDARDAQLLLGHSRISITQEIYQHDNIESRRSAIERVEQMLMAGVTSDGSRQISRQSYHSKQKDTNNNGGGPWVTAYEPPRQGPDLHFLAPAGARAPRTGPVAAVKLTQDIDNHQS